MYKTILSYDIKAKDWKEIFPSGKSNEIAKPEELPLIFFVEYDDEREDSPWERAWCKKCNAYEEIIRQDGNNLWTKGGCKLTGFCVKVSVKISKEGHNIWQHHSSDCTAYWLLRKDETNETVHITKKELYLSHTWEKDAHDGCVRLVPHPRYWSEKKAEFTAGMTFSTDTPQGVQDKVREMLKLPKEECVSGKSSTSQIVPVALEDVKENHQVDISYSDADHKFYEKDINGHCFHLIPSWETYQNITRSICGTYDSDESIRANATALLAIEYEGLYRMTFAVAGNKVLKSHSIYHNGNILAEVKRRIIWEAWNESVGLRDISSKDYAEIKDRIRIKPLTERQETSLLDLLTVPAEDIQPGYFLKLNLSLSRVNIPRVSAPTDKEDERQYLDACLPFLKRLFDAAWKDNAEAAYAMHLLYRSKSCFCNGNLRRSRYWFGRAVRSGWKWKEDLRLD